MNSGNPVLIKIYSSSEQQQPQLIIFPPGSCPETGRDDGTPPLATTTEVGWGRAGRNEKGGGEF